MILWISIWIVSRFFNDFLAPLYLIYKAHNKKFIEWYNLTLNLINFVLFSTANSNNSMKAKPSKIVFMLHFYFLSCFFQYLKSDRVKNIWKVSVVWRWNFLLTCMFIYFIFIFYFFYVYKILMLCVAWWEFQLFSVSLQFIFPGLSKINSIPKTTVG